jgi:hypothetical protein
VSAKHIQRFPQSPQADPELRPQRRVTDFRASHTAEISSSQTTHFPSTLLARTRNVKNLLFENSDPNVRRVELMPQ